MYRNRQIVLNIGLYVLVAVPLLYIDRIYYAIGIENEMAAAFVRRMIPFLFFKFVNWPYTSFLISCKRPDLSVYASVVGSVTNLVVVGGCVVMKGGLVGVCWAGCLANLARFVVSVGLAQALEDSKARLFSRESVKKLWPQLQLSCKSTFEGLFQCWSTDIFTLFVAFMHPEALATHTCLKSLSLIFAVLPTALQVTSINLV